MSRSIADFFIILFLCTVDGTPLGDKPESRDIKYGYLTYYQPDSWGKDAEVTFHWPRGVVKYLFDSSSYDDMLKDKLRLSMKSLEKEACVRFQEITKKPARNTSSWLHFTNQNKERGCIHTPIHQENGEIQVILGFDCLKQSEITHALMHGIGFRDEVTHPNRDLYVKILWNNIQPANWKLFGRYVKDDPELLSEYDPRSIMHFHDHAFSVNGQATISGLIPGVKIAPSENLSHLDKMKLGLKFGHECNKRKVGELLETCQGILSKNKNVSPNEADDLKPIAQVVTESTDKITSHEHNVIVLGHNKAAESKKKIPSNNNFYVDPPEPGTNVDQSDESQIPPEPRIDFDFENAHNEEPQMASDNETDQSIENRNEKDESISSSDSKESHSSKVGHNNMNDTKMSHKKHVKHVDITNKDDLNIFVVGHHNKLRPNPKKIAAQNNTNTSSVGYNHGYEENSKTLDKDSEDENDKESDVNLLKNNKYDKQNEEGLSYESVNVSPPKLNFDSDGGDTESENTNKGNVDIVAFNNKKKSSPNSKNIAAQNDTKMRHKKYEKHVAVTNKDDLNIVVVGHHNKLRPNSKKIAAQNNTNTSSVGYNNAYEENSETLDKDSEDENDKKSDVNLLKNNKYDKQNEEGLSYESENVSPPKLNFDSDGGDTESESTNKGNVDIVAFNNKKKLSPNSKNIDAQNYTKMSNKKYEKHVDVTNKDDLNIVVLGHHNKLRPNSKKIAAQNTTNTSSVGYNHAYEEISKTLDKDSEDENDKESDVNMGSDNNKYDKENEEGLSSDSENVSPPKLNFGSDGGDTESENTNKGNVDIVVFNNKKKLSPNSKNIAAQNDTKMSHKKNVKHVDITNKDDMNIFVVGHHHKLRPLSKNISAQNDTKISQQKKLKLVNITGVLADRTNNDLIDHKIKLAYLDMADTYEYPEDDKNTSISDINDNDENDANNIDENKVI